MSSLKEKLKMDKVVAGFSTLKDKTVDVTGKAVNFTKEGAKELQSKASKQNISQIARRGKHAMITTFGKTKASKDASFEIKHRSAHNSLVVLSELYKEFNLFVKHASAISDRYEAIGALIEKFRLSCDGYIAAETTEAEGFGDEDEGEDISFDNSPGGVDGSGGGGATGSSPSTKKKHSYNLENQQLQDENIQHIRRSISEIKRATDEMQATLQGSCMNLLSSTMKSLETETNRVQSDVVKASVDYDLARDELSKMQNEVDKMHESLRQADAHEMALSPQVREAVQIECQEKEERLQDMVYDANEKKEIFSRVTVDGRTDLLFTLEQTSMASWSCFNILFHQLQRFFGEIAKLSEPATTAMITLKNSQTVCQAIDRDRQKKLFAARLESERRAKESGAQPVLGGASGSPASATAKATAGSSSASKPSSDFDSLFSDFIDSRKEAIPHTPTPPPMMPSETVPPPATASTAGLNAPQMVSLYGSTSPGRNNTPSAASSTPSPHHHHRDPASNTNNGNNTAAGVATVKSNDGLDFFN